MQRFVDDSTLPVLFARTVGPLPKAARILTLLVFSFLLLVPAAGAQVPTTLNYQGRLLQNTADQDAAIGSVDIVFSIWSGPSGDGAATQLWSESWTGVALSNGIFSVLLGSNGSPLDPADFQGDSSLFLQLQIDGETLSPRQQLGSAPFAIVDEPKNELQDLSLAGDELTLSNSAAGVDLSPYLDNTDQQDLSLIGNTLALSNDATPVDLSGYLDNTDAQTLALSGNTLTISGSGSSVDLGETTEFSSFSDRLSVVEAALTRRVFVSSLYYLGNALGGLAGADAKCQGLADAAGLKGIFRAWLSDAETSAASRLDRLGFFETVTGVPIDDSWQGLTDGALRHAIDTNENGVAVPSPFRVWTGTEVDGSSAANVCNGWAGTGTQGQTGQASASGATWTANASSSCNAGSRLYCIEQASIGVDDQKLRLVGNELQLSSDDGTDTIDLSAYLDNTDNQKLSLSGSSLLLTSDDGTDTVSLASFLDNTDGQTLSLSGNNLIISGGNTVSLAAFKDNTDAQTLSLSGNNLIISGGNTVSLAAFKDNTDSQDLASVLANGTDAGDRDMTNLDDVDIDKLRIDNSFTCDASTASCITTSMIEQDTIGGNDIQDNIYILHIDCNGSCANMSMRDACNVIENLRGLSVEVELLGVSCVHGIPSTTGNGFVPCNDGTEEFTGYECRAFNLRTLGDLPCINDEGTDVIVTCLETDIPK